METIILENQIEEKMDSEMETGSIQGLFEGYRDQH